MSVAMMPGRTSKTGMPSAASRRAKSRAAIDRPALLTQYSPRLVDTASADTEVMNTMEAAKAGSARERARDAKTNAARPASDESCPYHRLCPVSGGDGVNGSFFLYRGETEKRRNAPLLRSSLLKKRDPLSPSPLFPHTEERKIRRA